MRSCQPTVRAAFIVQLAMICSRLSPNARNFVSVVGKSPTTPKPGWARRLCKSQTDDLGRSCLHPSRNWAKIEIEVTAGMTDVEENDAALLGFAHKRQESFRDRR